MMRRRREGGRSHAPGRTRVAGGIGVSTLRSPPARGAWRWLSQGVGRSDGAGQDTNTAGRSADPDRGRSAGVRRGDGSMPAAAARGSQRGFTLIEILLATTLLAAGLALGFATLRAATASVDRGERIAARTERMRAIDGFLRRRLASAAPIAFGVDPGTGRVLRFHGEPDRIRFVADLPDYLGRGGPHLHEISVLDRGGERTLAVSFAMVLAGETIATRDARPPEVLVPDLRGARFRYRGLGEDGGLGEWSDRWDQVELLPVQVSVELSSRSGGTWPPLLVTLPQRGGMVP